MATSSITKLSMNDLKALSVVNLSNKHDNPGRHKVKPLVSIQEKLTNNLSSFSVIDDADLSLIDLPDEILSRLFDHQKEGVAWLYQLHSTNRGGILGDDMGLGKTFQLICLLTGLIRMSSINRVLILAPVAVQENWNRELIQHLVPYVKKVNIQLISAEMTKKARIKALNQLFLSRYPSIILTSYQLFANMTSEFCMDEENNSNRIWDYAVLDEGHIIKNPSTKLYKSVHEISARHRIILSGTPIQNHLTEFWSLIDWISYGKVLGSKASFISRFADPITKGQDPQAMEHHLIAADNAIQELLRLIRPILLKRKKCEKQELLQLPTKIETVMWIPLSSSQRKLYEDYLAHRESPLLAINKLKTLCRHPLLLEAAKIAKQRSLEMVDDDQYASDDIDSLNQSINDLIIDNTENTLNSSQSQLNSIKKPKTSFKAYKNVFDIVGRMPDMFEILQGSVRLRVLLKLTKRLLRNKHRLLIFSQSKLLLDIIERLLNENDLDCYRIDGSLNSKERQKIIDDFNDGLDNDSYHGPDICLLTTKACGYGINLTGADRVIIFDPSWNPADDRQAVDRAYRIGQKKNVIVYRMIIAGSVEEKMYEKQVFKDGLRVMTESGTSSKYFSHEETKALFTLGPVSQSLVLDKLWQLQGGIEIRNPPEPITYDGDNLGGVIGYSRHDQLYEEIRPDEMRKPLNPTKLDSTSINSHIDRAIVSQTKQVNHPIKRPIQRSIFTATTSAMDMGIGYKSVRKPCEIIDLTESDDEEIVKDSRVSSNDHTEGQFIQGDYHDEEYLQFEEYKVPSTARDDTSNRSDTIEVEAQFKSIDTETVSADDQEDEDEDDIPVKWHMRPNTRRIIISDDESDNNEDHRPIVHHKSELQDSNHDSEKDEVNELISKTAVLTIDYQASSVCDEGDDESSRCRLESNTVSSLPLVTPSKNINRSHIGTPFIMMSDDDDDNDDSDEDVEGVERSVSPVNYQSTFMSVDNTVINEQINQKIVSSMDSDIDDDASDCVSESIVETESSDDIQSEHQSTGIIDRIKQINIDPYYLLSANHIIKVEDRNIPCFNPKDNVSERNKGIYATIIKEACQLEDNHDDWSTIANKYIDALEICDEDIQIHKKLELIYQMLNDGIQ